ESKIVYDFVRTETTAQNRQQFWLTLSQEGDIRERILRLGAEHEDLCEVTTTANALIAAYRATNPNSSRAILVHMGAQTTVLVIMLAAQGIFATSFQMGGDFFTRSLARLRHCSEATAESVKRASNLLAGPDACLEFAAVVDGWVAELKRQLNEWFEHNPSVAPEVASFDLIASGGAFDQPGLLDYLTEQAGLELKPWPSGNQSNAELPSKHFEVAFGVALQALGYSTQPVSLLPDDYRAAWQKRLRLQRFELASLGLAVLCLILLAVGTWHKISLIHHKRALLAKVQAAQEAVEANDALAAELASEYESFRPLFASQQNTLDTLRTLALLQQSRSNRSFWYVLLADQQTYFNQQPGTAPTNRLLRTNLFAAASGRPRASYTEFTATSSTRTNLSPGKSGFIAELCIPEDADGARRVRRELVDELKEQQLFSKVDLLSDDLRRNLADPKVIIPDRDFVLALDFAETQFQQSLPPRKPLPGTTSRTPPRRTTRPAWPPPENGENLGPYAP
ncbi:MAG: hypothetical protein NT154_30900, partial [Verrucomicrobia bacterium]|nr:hypothetical protein [Verrucomicrobiota bacterium]